MGKEKTGQQDKQVKQSSHKPKRGKVPIQESANPNPIPILQRAVNAPQSLSPAEAKTLQRTIGNQAIGKLAIQRKMTVGPVGDKYEQEADTVAKQVVNRLQTSQPQTPAAATVQRQEEEEDIQAKSLVQRQEEEEEIQMKPLPAISSLQRQSDSTLDGGEVSGDVETAVTNAKSGGQSLGNTVRDPMEKAFNADFSGVKIHTDGEADTLNRALNARAFTTGQDIFFRSGQYNPSSSGGQELLAHELTHVVQQSSNSIQKKEDKKASNPSIKNRTDGEGVHLQRRSNGVASVGPFRDLDGNGIYGSDVPVNAIQVSALIRQIQQRSYMQKKPLNIKVLTGTHGSSSGHLVGEANFYRQDLREEGNLANTGWINVNNVITAGSKDTVTNWMDHDNRAVILAWCYSANSYANWASRHCWKNGEDAKDWNKRVW